MTRITRLLTGLSVALLSMHAFALTKPTIKAVYPQVLTEGTRDVPLAVLGNDFHPGAVLLINGRATPTTVVGGVLAASYLGATPSGLSFEVVNPDGTHSGTFAIKVLVPVTKTPTPVTTAPPTGTGTGSGSTGSGSTGATGPTNTPSAPSAPPTSPTAPSTPSAPPTAPTTPTSPSNPGSTTWYVRTDGGTRYSSGQPTGQCDGKADAPYSGTGYNQHCAFKDVRYLWTDGSYTTGTTGVFPAWGWIGASGDTYILRGSIADGVSYRIGQNGPNSSDFFGLAGNPYAAGMPAPISGTASAHTRILGGNYGSCTAQSARTQLHGGYGVGAVVEMAGTSYVDVQCLDITDFSSCGRNGQANSCNTSYPLSDYATDGIQWSNTSTHDTLTDVRVHGLSAAGMIGPTGDDVIMTDVAIIGNASSGWNADAGDGTTGTGSLLVQNFNISWNGCAEEYPIVDALPYQDCTDDASNGYGDGFGTATVASNPGWKVHFDQGVASYNTQDGLDALHLNGAGSSVTFTRVLAYGNMGQQLKAGTGIATLQNNEIVTNCNAMRNAIPGTPAGYNSKLTDFCRAADTGIAVSVGAGQTLTIDNNTIYTASSTTLEIDCDGTYGPCDSTSKIDYRNNIFLGFLNNAANGYPSGGTGDYANPIWTSLNFNLFTNSGSLYSNNVTFRPKSNWTCPAAGEVNALCGVDPQLTDEVWHNYGFNNMAPLAGAAVLDRGAVISAITADFNGTTRANPPAIGAVEK